MTRYRYSIFATYGDGQEQAEFFSADKGDAELLYRIATESGIFDYVSLNKMVEGDVTMKEWVSHEQ